MNSINVNTTDLAFREILSASGDAFAGGNLETGRDAQSSLLLATFLLHVARLDSDNDNGE